MPQHRCSASWDLDPAMAVTARKRLLDMAAPDRSI
jgi:hypothetical protein